MVKVSTCFRHREQSSLHFSPTCITVSAVVLVGVEIAPACRSALVVALRVLVAFSAVAFAVAEFIAVTVAALQVRFAHGVHTLLAAVLRCVRAVQPVKQQRVYRREDGVSIGMRDHACCPRACNQCE